MVDPFHQVADHVGLGVDAEANVIRNLMERIDHLENTVTNLKRCLQEVAAGRQLLEECSGEAQNLKDREILEFLGDSTR